jgi:hypothetical protein
MYVRSYAVKLWFLLILLAVDAPLPQPAATTGIKMTIRNRFQDISIDSTIYLQSDRRREEYRNSQGQQKGPLLASITRCDLGQQFELNLEAAQYVSAPYPLKPITQEQAKALGLNTPQVPQSGKPTLRIETTTRDTGERKEIFGYTARHVIANSKQIPLEGSHAEAEDTVTDGWYIDLDSQISCEPKFPKGAVAYVYASGRGLPPPDTPQFVNVGVPENGFAVQLTRTSKSTFTLPDGTKRKDELNFETRVVQLEKGSIDPGVFEIPSGFKQVQNLERNPGQQTPPTLWERLKSVFSSSN